MHCALKLSNLWEQNVNYAIKPSQKIKLAMDKEQKNIVLYFFLCQKHVHT